MVVVMTVLDEPIACPRCGVKTSSVDEIGCRGRVLLRLCAQCAQKPLDGLLVEFRRLVDDIKTAVDHNCTDCSGQGWRALRGGPAFSTRLQPCPTCCSTGIDMVTLLEVLGIQQKPKPKRHDPGSGFASGGSARDKAHKG